MKRETIDYNKLSPHLQKQLYCPDLGKDAAKTKPRLHVRAIETITNIFRRISK